MDSNDNSTDKEDSTYNDKEDLNSAETERSHNKGEGARANNTNMNIPLKQVPAKEMKALAEERDDDEDENTASEEDERDEPMDSDVNMKELGRDSLQQDIYKNAGILESQTSNNSNNNNNNTNPIHKPAREDNHYDSVKDNSPQTSNEIPSLQSPSIPCENDDKTQSSSISSAHASSTPSSTPPTATVVVAATGHDCSPANSAGNTPPSDISTPKHSPESVEQSPPSEKSPPLENEFIQQPINVVRNGTIPNAGKPLLSTMSRKLERSAKASRSRKPKSSVPLYESEVSLKRKFHIF